MCKETWERISRAREAPRQDILADFFLWVLFCLVDVFAQVSLYIPGVDPQALSATALGVGPGGRTTWEIHPGVTSGDYDEVTFSGTGESFFGVFE